jgi:hypothetical protein
MDKTKVNVKLSKNILILVRFGVKMSNRHKVFISYHHENDQIYRDKFEALFADIYNIIVTKSVQIGDIDPNLKTETIRQKIRDEYLRDSTVTIVLIGKLTWQRKHVDWEISSSIRDTALSPRSGLMGILLPTHPDYLKETFNRYTMPPRLFDNVNCKFSKVYKWNTNPSSIQSWIHEAFENRNKINPNNSFPLFVNNRTGSKWQDN